MALAFLDQPQAKEWVRVIGAEARPLPANVVSIAQFQKNATDLPWSNAMSQLTGSGALQTGADRWIAADNFPVSSGQDWVAGRAAIAVELVSTVLAARRSRSGSRLSWGVSRMAQQSELFPEPTVVVRPSGARGEPRLWVRRLAIWEKPGTIIRDISLRRGLNIIWSPDPGVESAVVGRGDGSGHGAGKTLFCRLLRYCLGEDTFANDDLRRSVAEQLPTGLGGDRSPD